MKRGRFYDPPFLLKVVLLICLVLISVAHRKGWMQRTVGSTLEPTTQSATMMDVTPAKR